MQQIAQPKTFFAARRWVVVSCLQGLLIVFLGSQSIIDGGWAAFLGGAAVAMSPFHFWLAWWLARYPLIEIQRGMVRQRAVGSIQEAATSLEEVGPLKWSTRSNLCFEHRRKGFLVVGVIMLSRPKRDALLQLLTVGP